MPLPGLHFEAGFTAGTIYVGAKRGSNVSADGRCRELVVLVSPGNSSILVLAGFPVPSNKTFSYTCLAHHSVPTVQNMNCFYAVMVPADDLETKTGLNCTTGDMTIRPPPMNDSSWAVGGSGEDQDTP